MNHDYSEVIVTEPIIEPRFDKTNVALEKLKRRNTSIRSFSSSLLSDALSSSSLQEGAMNRKVPSPLTSPGHPTVNHRFSIRRSNSTRHRLSMSLEKLLETGRNEFQDIKSLPTDPTKSSQLSPVSRDIISPSSPSSLPSEMVFTQEPQDLSPTEQTVSICRLYLQLDSKIKKVSYNGPLSISSLKMLFVEKFQYNPGPLQFPDLYIKDPILDVYYELEDLSEVREGTVLQLNVTVSSNDLKKNMDSNFSTLVMEIRDLRRLMSHNTEVTRKQTMRQSTVIPSSRFSDLTKKPVSKPKDLDPASTNSSTNTAVDLQPLRAELDTLRRDLAMVRQATNDFEKDSHDILTHIKQLGTSFHDQIKSDNNMTHQLLASGKDRMEQTTMDLANMLEDIQKNVEDFRQDLVQRRCQPSQIRLKHTEKLMEKVNQMILTESEYISDVKPTWKKTWEVMLQGIVKEQQILKEQEAIMVDMRADYENLNETLQQLKQFIELKRRSRHRPSFEVAAEVDEDSARQTLLQEISCVETNSERRLRAFEESQKSREWELKNQVSPFEEELSDFVGTCKLRKTGGTVELDKKRRQQDEDNLKAMLAPKPRPPRSARRTES